METKISTKIFLYFCTLAALFVSVSGFLTARGIEAYIFQLVFLPVTLFLLISTIKSLVNKNYSIGINISVNKAVVFTVLFIILSGISIKSILNKQKQTPETPNETIVLAPSASPEINVPKNYLTIKSPSPNLLVNIRASNSTSSEILEEAEDGKKYEYINSENNWYEIVLEDGKSGWVFSTYASLEEGQE